MTIRQNTAFAVFKKPRRVPDLIKAAQAIVNASTGNHWLPSPSPPLAELQAAVDELREADAATVTRAAGTVAERGVKRRALNILFDAFKAYVQRQADLDPEHAVAIITSAGFTVRKESSRRKAPIVIKRGPVAGSVIIEVRAAAKRASYQWGWSDDGGKTWNAEKPTLKAKTTIFGLPVGKLVQFRYRAIKKAGPGDWCEPVEALVM